jgi:hypothetical protein
MRDIDFTVYRHAMAQLDELAGAMEAKWGVDRLPRLVPADLAEKFYSQLDKLNAAIEVGSPADIEHHAGRMQNAWRALDGAAVAAGALPLSVKALEGRLPDGRVLVVVDGVTEQWAAAQANRGAVVWNMAEIARVLHEFELTNTAKTIFPGAEVINTRPPPTRPPVDWSKGDDLPLDMRAAG